MAGEGTGGSGIPGIFWCYLLKEGQAVGVGLRGRDAARHALGRARLALELRGLLGIQVKGVNVKGHGGRVHVS